MPEKKIFVGDQVVWKIEGNVVSFLRTTGTPLTPEKFAQREKLIMDRINEWRAKGIKVVEFLIPAPTHPSPKVCKYFNAIKEVLDKHNLKLEVREAGKGMLFCQLLL